MRALLILALAGISIGQTRPKDVDGWGKIKWGMTVSEARSACGCPNQSIDVANIELGIHLSASRSEADRYKADSKPIAEIELSAVTAPPMGNVFEKLKNPLTQKYGLPTSEDRKPDGAVTASTAFWVFPSTIIELEWRESSSTGYIVLTYKKTDKKDLNSL